MLIESVSRQGRELSLIIVTPWILTSCQTHRVTQGRSELSQFTHTHTHTHRRTHARTHARTHTHAHTHTLTHTLTHTHKQTNNKTKQNYLCSSSCAWPVCSTALRERRLRPQYLMEPVCVSSAVCRTFAMCAVKSEGSGPRRVSINTCIRTMREGSGNYDSQLLGCQNVGHYAGEGMWLGPGPVGKVGGP